MTTILLVEDDKKQRLLYEQELKHDGYEVVTASDGKEALEKVLLSDEKTVVVAGSFYLVGEIMKILENGRAA